MDITRNVIIDLLPLYAANEVSADTRALVEEYLETDPELAHLAKESAAMALQRDIPVPLTREDQMKAYVKARRLRLLYTVILAGLMAVALVMVLASFFISSS